MNVCYNRCLWLADGLRCFRIDGLYVFKQFYLEPEILHYKWVNQNKRLCYRKNILLLLFHLHIICIHTNNTFWHSRIIEQYHKYNLSINILCKHHFILYLTTIDNSWLIIRRKYHDIKQGSMVMMINMSSFLSYFVFDVVFRNT